MGLSNITMERIVQNTPRISAGIILVAKLLFIVGCVSLVHNPFLRDAVTI